MSFTRRNLLKLAAAAASLPSLNVLPLRAQEREWRHGLSLFGELKYSPGFKHFDYVNASAPKAGMVRLSANGTFDNLNLVVAGIKGSLASGIFLFVETLMTSAQDEVSTEYGLIAESVSHPADFSSVTYRLRAEAKWHDGKPITVEDVIFSLDVLKANSPRLAAYYSHVTKVEKTGEREVTFTFDQPGNRELPQIVGQLYVLPKHYWEGTDKSGNKRNIANTTLEPPLASGPYRIKDSVPGRSIVYERVKEYWGANLNVNVGKNNFDEIRYEYFRDNTVALEAFKGDRFDWRVENSAKDWATAYDFPALNDKRVLKEEFEIRSSGGMQGFAFNIRRDKFKDARVRRAFNYALDFEEMNKQLFYGMYKRIGSYFEGLELASSGLPEGRELAILETVRGKVPPEVFTQPYVNPVNGDPQKVRANMREALRLLKEAGYEIKDTKLVNKAGEQLSVEFLLAQPTFERLVLFYKPSLERLGIQVSVRTVDPQQYENRLRQWDFDVTVDSQGQSLSPGNEQRGYWGSKAADQPGSENTIGIKDAAIDALIDRVIFATSRDELVAATKALDRVLLWNFFVVPNWTYSKQRTARWDRFGRPAEMPKYGLSAFPTIWWWDAEKAAKTRRA